MDRGAGIALGARFTVKDATSTTQIVRFDAGGFEDSNKRICHGKVTKRGCSSDVGCFCEFDRISIYRYEYALM